MGCKITVARAPNGENSNVYASISKVYGAEVGLVAYLHMHSPEFINEYGNKPKDENGEYNYKLVLDSMKESGRSITSIVEKSVGLLKGNGTYASFTDAKGKSKMDELNKLFIANRTPFKATLKIDTNGNTIINVDLTSSVNQDPSTRKGRGSSRNERGGDVIETWLAASEEGQDRLDNYDNDVVMDMLSEDRDLRRAAKTKSNHKLKNLLKSIALQRTSLERRLSVVESRLKLAQTEDDATKVQMLKAKLAEHKVNLEIIKTREEDTVKMGGLRPASKVASTELAGISKKTNTAAKLKDLELEELVDMQRVLKFWAAAGSFDQDGEHVLFSGVEEKSKVLKDLFRAHKTFAEDLLGKVDKQLDSRFEVFLKEQLGSNVKMKDVMKLAKDINFFEANGLDISRTDNAILQAIYKSVTQQEQRAIQDSDAISAEIDEMMPDVTKELTALANNGEDPFSFFAQKNDNGDYSGDAFQEVSYDFIQEKQKKFFNIIYDNKSTHKEKKAARKWSKDNEFIMDFRRLFPHDDNNVWEEGDDFNDKDRAAHILELKEHMGSEAIDNMVLQLGRNLATFNLERTAKAAEVYSEVHDDMSSKRAGITMLKWEMENSPFYASKSHITGAKNKVRGKDITPRGIKHTMFVPKKSINGKPTNYYDKNFQRMQNNPTLKKFYEYYTDTMAELNMVIPHSKRQKFKANSISFVQRTMKEMSLMRNGKVHKGSLGFLARAAVNSVSSKEYSDITSANTDPITGDKIRHVQANFINDGKSELRELVRNKQLVWQASNKGDAPSKAQVAEWRYEALNELASGKSYDLGTTLKHYAQLANAYKYKSAVEDEVHLAYNMFQRIKEGDTNSRGMQMRDQYGDDEANNKGMRQMSSQLDHFMDRFNNFKTREDTTSSKKVFTAEEKVVLKKLQEALSIVEQLKIDKKISPKKYVELKHNLEERIEATGNNLSLTKVGDNLLNFSQLAGMGWNIPAGVVNRLFGWASNVLEAASGRFISVENYKLANKIVGGYSTVGGTKKSKKAIAIAKKWGIVVDTQKEVNEGLESALFGWLPEALQPYAIGNRVELANQAPIMVGKMLDTIVEDDNGNKVNLFEAFDDSGVLKSNFSNIKKDWDGVNADATHNGEKQKLIGAISQVIKKTHGNYHLQSPVKGKETLPGRALFQFKSWLPEAIAARFETEKYDAVLGMTRKGRYRSVYDTFHDRFEGDGAIQYLSFLTGKFTRVMVRAITGKYNPKDGLKMSDVDIQNMREVAKELQLIFLGGSAALMLTLFRDSQWDEDDENEIGGPKWVLTLAINNLNKTIADLAAFTSPTWMFDLLQRPVAGVGIIDDVKDNITALIKIASGDYEIKTGINAGWNRAGKEVAEFTPFLNQLLKIKQMGQRVYADPKGVISVAEKEMADWLMDGK